MDSVYKINDYVLFMGIYLYKCTHINEYNVYLEFVNTYYIDENSLPIKTLVLSKLDDRYAILKLPKDIDISLFNHPNYIKKVGSDKKILECRGLSVNVGDLICTYNNISNKMYYGLLYSNLVCLTENGFMEIVYDYVKVDWDFEEKSLIIDRLTRLYNKHISLSFNKELESGELFLYSNKVYLYLGCGQYIKHLNGYEVANFNHVYLYLEYSCDSTTILKRYNSALLSGKLLKVLKDDLFCSSFVHSPYPNISLEGKLLIPDFLYEKYDITILSKCFYLIQENVGSGYIFKTVSEVDNISEYMNYEYILLE